MAGYSGRPLHAKLGLKAGQNPVLLNAPESYMTLLGSGVPDLAFQDQLVEGADFIHVFTTCREELDEFLKTSLSQMPRDCMIWVSWPKKASKVPTDVTEDVIREVGLPLGLVDVKVCAVDPVWSGLKLVIRKELR